MNDIQHSSSPKSKMATSFRSRCMCCILETNLTRKFAADLSLQIFLIHYISRYGYDSSPQFGDYFSRFGRQSEKFSRTGACIRRNFRPCSMKKLATKPSPSIPFKASLPWQFPGNHGFKSFKLGMFKGEQQITLLTEGCISEPLIARESNLRWCVKFGRTDSTGCDTTWSLRDRSKSVGSLLLKEKYRYHNY